MRQDGKNGPVWVTGVELNRARMGLNYVGSDQVAMGLPVTDSETLLDNINQLAAVWAGHTALLPLSTNLVEKGHPLKKFEITNTIRQAEDIMFAEYRP